MTDAAPFETPCPKCGSPDVHLRHVHRKRRKEHLSATCRTCYYYWRMDVLPAPKTAVASLMDEYLEAEIVARGMGADAVKRPSAYYCGLRMVSGCPGNICKGPKCEGKGRWHNQDADHLCLRCVGR